MADAAAADAPPAVDPPVAAVNGDAPAPLQVEGAVAPEAAVAPNDGTDRTDVNGCYYPPPPYHGPPIFFNRHLLQSSLLQKLSR